MQQVYWIGIVTFLIVITVIAKVAGYANAPQPTEASILGFRAADETRAAQVATDRQAEHELAKNMSDANLQQQQNNIKREYQSKESEKRAAEALAALASLATIKEEERGLVLTLSESVLFLSAESTLLTQTDQKLGRIVKALLAMPACNLIVEGHTDSQGSDAYNQELSLRRADAVREYLIQKGYPADRIKARGKGEYSPIAQNSSAEGRANNRRVEIVIERQVQALK